MRDHGPKVRLSRRFGIALTPKAAKVLERKPAPPGQHGKDGRPEQVSDYKKQLTQKQLLRCHYNIREKQMRRYYSMASKSRGNSAERLVQLLETRLDALVLRAGFAPTIYAARQYVSHGHFLVNGQRVNIPSYAVRPGDVVSIRPKSQPMVVFQNVMPSGAALGYLAVSAQERTAQLVRLPLSGEVPIICELNRVIEFYSR
ncbi:MAG: 30S ribosomal protein S4 [Anaerolineaceae bacterium]|nr:30S ribosomal protein S4 [Anaerolineaceae bacterium]